MTSTSTPSAPEPVTFNGIRMVALEQLPGGITLYAETPNNHFGRCHFRLHDGRIFRGYAHTNWSNRKGEPRWRVEAWGHTGARHTVKTERGARAALKRLAAATA